MQCRKVQLNGKTFEVKFGLKSLIELSKKVNIDVRDALYQGIKTLQPDTELSFLSLVSCNELAKAEEVISEIFSPNDLPTPRTIDEWFKKGIGEIGIPLSDFYCLTPYELDLAYEGYLRRMELQANLAQLSFLRALNKDSDPIQVVKEQEITMGTLKEREETLSHLGIRGRKHELQ